MKLFSSSKIHDRNTKSFDNNHNPAYDFNEFLMVGVLQIYTKTSTNFKRKSKLL
jgi:hypothetical protein